MNSGHPGGQRISRRQALTGLAAGAVAIGGVGAMTRTSAEASSRPRSLRQYPKGIQPSEIYAVPNNALTGTEQVLAATLQGRLASSGADNGPAIYLKIPGIGYEIWLDEIRDRYGIPVHDVSTVWELVDRFDVDSYVLYDQTDGSVNAATSLAGISDAVVVEAGLEQLAQQHGLRPVADVRGKNDQWARANHWSSLRHDLVVEQKPGFTAQLRDYATMAGALMFYDGNSAFRREVIDGMTADGTVIGWGDASSGEHTFVGMSSEVGAKHIPADHARNLSCLSGIRHTSLTQSGDSSVPDPTPDTHHATFLLTDGDNIQWLLGDFATSERWYGSPHRGSFDMGWGMAPSLIDLAPSVMRWYYENESTGEHSDRFVVGPSGGGYMYPSHYPRAELDQHTDRLAALMERADLNTVQILDFEAQDNTDLWSSYLRHSVIEGLIYLEYSRYDGGNGKVVWANDKPVISARGMLWGGLSGADEASVTNLLNTAGRDPYDVTGYSVIMVHAWSKDLSHVRTVIDGLRPHVKLVPPDTLVKMVRRNARR